jgi:hypothetical protein
MYSYSPHLFSAYEYTGHGGRLFKDEASQIIGKLGAIVVI